MNIPFRSVWAFHLGLTLVLLVWFTAHTNALRYGLLGILLLGALWRSDVRQALLPTLKLPLTFFGVMTIWAMVQLFWAWSVPETLSELKSQWFKGWLILICGAAVTLALTPFGMFRRPEGGFVVLGRVSEVLSLVLFIQLLDYGRLYFFFDVLPRDATALFGYKTEISYLANLLFAFCLAECLARYSGLRPILPHSLKQLCVSMSISLLILFISGARFGVLGLIFLFFSCSVLILFILNHEQRAPLLKILLLLFLGVLAASWISWKSDPRWQRLFETIPHALNIDHPSWVDSERYPYPILSDGAIVERSAYERVAFLSTGLRLSAEMPFGMGFTRQAFSHAVEAEYGQSVVHAHSGLVEWLLAWGWIGGVLWFGFLLSLMQRGLLSFLFEQRALGLLLFCVVSGFWSRMLIENISRDAVFEFFMFLLGILLATWHRDGACQRSYFHAPLT